MMACDEILSHHWLITSSMINDLRITHHYYSVIHVIHKLGKSLFSSYFLERHASKLQFFKGHRDNFPSVEAYKENCVTIHKNQ